MSSRYIDATLRFFDKFTGPMTRATDKIQAQGASIEKYGKKIERYGNKISSVGSKMTLGITVPVALVGASMAKAASDYEENLNKIDVAFGKSGSSVKKWADDATTQFGMSKNQALESAAQFGDMSTSMGLSQEKAAKMSKSLTGLSGDLASFKNIGTGEAMTALNGIFTGETESLKQIGVVMTQQNLNEFAKSKGIKKTVQQMSQAEQVQLRYAYVMSKTKNAQGDYARTADGTANSMRTFKAEVENLKIAFGQHLLPAITPILKSLTKLIKRFAELPKNTQANILKFALFAAAAGPVLKVFGSMTSGVGKTIKAIGKFGKAVDKAGGFAKIFPNSIGKISHAMKMARDPAEQTSKALYGSYSKAKLFKKTGPITGGIKKIGGAFKIMGAGAIRGFKSVGRAFSAVGKLFMAKPWLIAIMAIVAATILIIKNWDKVKAFFLKIWGPISKFFGKFKKAITGFASSAKSKFKEFGASAKEYFGTRWKNTVNGAVSIANKMKSGFSKHFKTAAIVTRKLAKDCGNSTHGIKGYLGGMTKFVSGVFTGDWKKAWKGVVQIFKTIFNGIKSIAKAPLNAVISLINKAIDGINKFKIPDKKWIPKSIRGAGLNVPHIPMLAKGTNSFPGGYAIVGENGPEITRLPRGSAVYSNQKSKGMIGGKTVNINKLAETIVVREEADIDKITYEMAKKMKEVLSETA